jgi:hypothetical protein
MSLTLGLTGMDPATEAALKAAFLEANARLGGRWSLVSDAEAEHVVVDMDSMYGPMSWLRLHAAGRQVVGLTSAPRTQTDYRLGRPFDTAQLVALLADIAQGAGIELQAGGGDAPQTPQAPAPVPAPVPAREPATAAAPVAAPAPAQNGTIEAPATTPADADAEANVAPMPGPSSGAGPEQAATERTLAAWLVPGALRGQVRYRSSAGPTLLIDATADCWHGPTPLKPIAPYFDGIVDEADFELLDPAAWGRESASAGPAQPLSRLRWLGGLLAGGGELLPGLDPDARFQLNKWPQTEREYPRHFRIATQMMKGAATVAEIAEGSGVPAADVCDFINASIATGFAEVATEAPQPAEDSARPRGGLLGRLRSR